MIFFLGAKALKFVIIIILQRLNFTGKCMVSCFSEIVNHPNVALTMMRSMVVSLLIVVLKVVSIVLVVCHDIFPFFFCGVVPLDYILAMFLKNLTFFNKLFSRCYLRTYSREGCLSKKEEKEMKLFLEEVLGCRSRYINQEISVALGSLSFPRLHIGTVFTEINFFLKKFIFCRLGLTPEGV